MYFYEKISIIIIIIIATYNNKSCSFIIFSYNNHWHCHIMPVIFAYITISMSKIEKTVIFNGKERCMCFMRTCDIISICRH